jgi:hypothetical protein
VSRRFSAAFGLAGLGALGLPAAASAHGIVGRADLPIPAWLFAWTAGGVLVISFVALGALWSAPQLTRPAGRELLSVPRFAEWACATIGILLFAIVVVAGLAGTQNYTSNFAPTFIYVIFWVGLPILSGLIGDVFGAFNPWRAIARVAGRLVRRARPSRGPLLSGYPKRWGRWPAAAGLFTFAWLELVYPSKDDPRLLALLALVYAGAQLAGMALYGVEQWTTHADGFAVYFGLIARLSPLCWRERRLRLRRPLAGLCDLELWPGTFAVICVLLGSTTFDGFSNGDIWARSAPHMESWLDGTGLSAIGRYEVISTLGLLFCIAFVGVMYRWGIRGMTKATQTDGTELTRAFLHTLVPIVYGYLVAHYFSLLVLEGPAMIYLASDPLGRGEDLFGTAQFLVNYNLISFAAIWYVQVAAIVTGHVGGLTLSHERGLVIFHDTSLAVRAQHWMLIVMVGFTCLALWLLSAVTTATG